MAKLTDFQHYGFGTEALLAIAVTLHDDGIQCGVCIPCLKCRAEADPDHDLECTPEHYYPQAELALQTLSLGYAVSTDRCLLCGGPPVNSCPKADDRVHRQTLPPAGGS